MNYSKLITENVNPDTVDIDVSSTEEILGLIHNEDMKAAPAVGGVLPDIARAVDVITERLRNGGRLIYMGAGTSGRLGVLDASECPPTFGTDPHMVVGLIAGGDKALRDPIEGAEDSPEGGEADLKNIDLTSKDVVVGIAASGSTPYVRGGLDYAKSVGAATIALCCTNEGSVIDAAETAILPVAGPEAIMGSTRMKAGTAQKMVLNMLTTATMVKLGKVYHNLMVDLTPTNKKLQDRSVRIIMQACGVDRGEAEKALEAGGSTKTAILMLLCGCGREKADELLKGGKSIRAAMSELSEEIK